MTAPKPTSETRLVVLAQLGDRSALDRLLRSTEDWLLRYLRRLAGDADLALEVLQDVYLAICRHLKFLHDPGLYRPWVYRIASRQAFRRLRRRRRRRDREHPLVADAPAPDPRPLDPLLRDALRRSVTRLPPRVRAVVLLHYFEELSQRETAEILDLPIGTVKSRLAYGLQRLRDLIPEGDPNETR